VKNSTNGIQAVSTSATNTSGIATYIFTQSVAGVYTVTASNTNTWLEQQYYRYICGSCCNIVVTANISSPIVNETVNNNATVKDSSGVTSGALDGQTINSLKMTIVLLRPPYQMV